MVSESWTKERLFSSARQDWATPQPLFDELDGEFGFRMDAASSRENAKCPLYLTEQQDGLAADWLQLVGDGGAVWLNPPYGRQVGKWVRKAYAESLRGVVVVCLIFCRTDVKWWHDWAMRAAEVRLIPGRLRFEGAEASAPAPSCVLVFDESRRLPRFTVQALPRR